jgi:lysophospholipase L1-like esterase
MPTYTFRFSPDVAGYPVTVTNAAGATVASGTLGHPATPSGAVVYTADLAPGTYTGTAGPHAQSGRKATATGEFEVTADYLSTTFEASHAARDRAYRTWDSQVADLSVTPRMFILGHSVVAGSGASDQPHCFAKLLRYRVTAQRRNAVVSISGSGGATTTSLLANLPGTFASEPAGSVGCLVIMGMVNDYSGGIAPATTKSNLQNIISTLRAHASAAANMSVVIAVEWERSDVPTPAYPWSQYVDVAEQVADADTYATVVDLGTRIGRVADASSLFSDSVHPNDKGHALIAGLLHEDLMRPAPRSLVSPHTLISTLQAPVASTNWSAFPNLISGSNAFGNVVRDSDGTQNADITYEFVGDAGMYTIGIAHRASTNRGKYDVYIDGALQGTGGSFDGYQASLQDRHDSVSNFYIGTSGLHTIRFRMSTKHASSTGYVGSLSAIVISRTADLTT